MDEVVGYDVVDGVAHVTIQRPEVRNAMSLAVFDQLTECGERAAADGTVGTVLVSGRGGTFSSGIDLSVLGDQLQDGIEPAFIARLQAAFTVFEDIDKPTVAAVEGHCLGAGIQLAAACHLRALAPDATLSVMESRWGLIPDLGGSHRIPRLVGLGRATELTLTARRVGAEEALAIGLAEVALGGDDPVAQAHELAARLAAGPGAVRRAPRLLRDNLGRGREQALAAEAEAQIACLHGPDVAEAVRAGVEEREPRFVGR